MTENVVFLGCVVAAAFLVVALAALKLAQALGLLKDER